jgi:hypothetical protein
MYLASKYLQFELNIIPESLFEQQRPCGTMEQWRNGTTAQRHNGSLLKG